MTFFHNVETFTVLLSLPSLYSLHTSLRPVSKHYTGHVMSIQWFSTAYKLKLPIPSTQPLYSGVEGHLWSWTSLCSYFFYLWYWKLMQLYLFRGLQICFAWSHFWILESILLLKIYHIPVLHLLSLRLNSNATSSIKPGQRLKQQVHGDQRHQTFQDPKKVQDLK